jgi:nucleoside transporter
MSKVEMDEGTPVMDIEVAAVEEPVEEAAPASTKNMLMALVSKFGVPVFMLGWLIAAIAHDSSVAIESGAVWIVFAYFLFATLSLVFKTEKVQNALSSFGGGLDASLDSRPAQILIALVTLGIFALSFGTAYDNTPERIISVVGLFAYVLLCYIFSWNRRAVIWRPVVGGLLFQFIFANIILRTDVGFETFKFLGDQVTILLDYTVSGSSFVYGYLATGLVIGEATLGNVNVNMTNLADNSTVNYMLSGGGAKLGGGYMNFGVFYFSVLSTIIFFSALVSSMFYFGILQVVIDIIGRFMATLLGTSASESLNAAGNIFVGQTEAPLLIRPFLKDMTESELHAVMTGGFATIAGGVLAVYISFGIDPSHLLSASVMSAPAALAISKLLVPETEESKTAAGKKFVMEPVKETSAIEAASSGAAVAVTLVLNIAGQLIAFLALVAMVDAWLAFFGSTIGVKLSFEIVCGVVFYPLAYLMGVAENDCSAVAKLLGTKLFVNEFAAYDDLAKVIRNDPEAKYELESRSIVIATYALCGFSNLGSIGIQLGGLGSMAPNQLPKLSKLVFSAMIAGNIACFMTACIAGMLYDPARIKSVV